MLKPKFARFAWLPILALTLLLLASCSQRFKILMEPVRPDLKAVTGNPALHFSGVVDAREIKSELGVVRNTFGKVIGQIVVERPADEMFDEEIALLLKKAGFKVSQGAEGGSRTPVLSAEILELSSVGKGATAEGKAVLAITLKRGGKKLLSRKLEGYQLRTTLWGLSAKSFQTVVNEALDQVMQKTADFIGSDEFLAAAENK